tara:strand:- start:3544 stop:10227 length:6684 start_codon:yes stop_codon:yes gene_type:complete
MITTQQLLQAGSVFSYNYSDIDEADSDSYYISKYLSVRVRAYNEEEHWYVEGKDAWSFYLDNDVLKFSNHTHMIEYQTIFETPNIREHLTKYMNDFVFTIDIHKQEPEIIFYVNGEAVANVSDIHYTKVLATLGSWKTVQMHGGSGGKTIFDHVTIKIGHLWSPDKVQQILNSEKFVLFPDITFLQYGFRNTLHDMIDVKSTDSTLEFYSNIDSQYYGTIANKSVVKWNQNKKYNYNTSTSSGIVLNNNTFLAKRLSETQYVNQFAIRLKTRMTDNWTIYGGNVEKDTSIRSFSSWCIKREYNNLEFVSVNAQEHETKSVIEITTTDTYNTVYSDIVVNVNIPFVNIYINGVKQTKIQIFKPSGWDLVKIVSNQDNTQLDLFEILLNKIWSEPYIQAVFIPDTVQYTRVIREKIQLDILNPFCFFGKLDNQTTYNVHVGVNDGVNDMLVDYMNTRSRIHFYVGEYKYSDQQQYNLFKIATPLSLKYKKSYHGTDVNMGGVIVFKFETNPNNGFIIGEMVDRSVHYMTTNIPLFGVEVQTKNELGKNVPYMYLVFNGNRYFEKQLHISTDALHENVTIHALYFGVVYENSMYSLCMRMDTIKNNVIVQDTSNTIIKISANEPLMCSTKDIVLFDSSLLFSEINWFLHDEMIMTDDTVNQYLDDVTKKYTSNIHLYSILWEWSIFELDARYPMMRTSKENVIEYIDNRTYVHNPVKIHNKPKLLGNAQSSEFFSFEEGGIRYALNNTSIQSRFNIEFEKTMDDQVTLGIYLWNISTYDQQRHLQSFICITSNNDDTSGNIDVWNYDSQNYNKKGFSLESKIVKDTEYVIKNIDNNLLIIESNSETQTLLLDSNINDFDMITVNSNWHGLSHFLESSNINFENEAKYSFLDEHFQFQVNEISQNSTSEQIHTDMTPPMLFFMNYELTNPMNDVYSLFSHMMQNMGVDNQKDLNVGCETSTKVENNCLRITFERFINIETMIDTNNMSNIEFVFVINHTDTTGDFNPDFWDEEPYYQETESDKFQYDPFVRGNDYYLIYRVTLDLVKYYNQISSTFDLPERLFKVEIENYTQQLTGSVPSVYMFIKNNNNSGIYKIPGFPIFVDWPIIGVSKNNIQYNALEYNTQMLMEPGKYTCCLYVNASVKPSDVDYDNTKMVGVYGYVKKHSDNKIYKINSIPFRIFANIEYDFDPAYSVDRITLDRTNITFDGNYDTNIREIMFGNVSSLNEIDWSNIRVTRFNHVEEGFLSQPHDNSMHDIILETIQFLSNMEINRLPTQARTYFSTDSVFTTIDISVNNPKVVESTQSFQKVEKITSLYPLTFDDYIIGNLLDDNIGNVFNVYHDGLHLILKRDRCSTHLHPHIQYMADTEYMKNMDFSSCLEVKFKCKLLKTTDIELIGLQNEESDKEYISIQLRSAGPQINSNVNDSNFYQYNDRYRPDMISRQPYNDVYHAFFDDAYWNVPIEKHTLVLPTDVYYTNRIYNDFEVNLVYDNTFHNLGKITQKLDHEKYYCIRVLIEPYTNKYQCETQAFLNIQFILLEGGVFADDPFHQIHSQTITHLRVDENLQQLVPHYINIGRPLNEYANYHIDLLRAQIKHEYNANILYHSNVTHFVSTYPVYKVQEPIHTFDVQYLIELNLTNENNYGFESFEIINHAYNFNSNVHNQNLRNLDFTHWDYPVHVTIYDDGVEDRSLYPTTLHANVYTNRDMIRQYMFEPVTPHEYVSIFKLDVQDNMIQSSLSENILFSLSKHVTSEKIHHIVNEHIYYRYTNIPIRNPTNPSNNKYTNEVDVISKLIQIDKDLDYSSGNISFELWFYVSNINDEDVIANIDTITYKLNRSTNDDYSFHMNINANSNEYIIQDTSNITGSDYVYPFVYETWYHLCLVNIYNSNAIIYINGEKHTQNFEINPLSPSKYFEFGNIKDGYIYDFTIYDIALSQRLVTYLHEHSNYAQIQQEIETYILPDSYIDSENGNISYYQINLPTHIFQKSEILSIQFTYDGVQVDEFIDVSNIDYESNRWYQIIPTLESNILTLNITSNIAYNYMDTSIIWLKVPYFKIESTPPTLGHHVNAGMMFDTNTYILSCSSNVHTLEDDFFTNGNIDFHLYLRNIPENVSNINVQAQVLFLWTSNTLDTDSYEQFLYDHDESISDAIKHYRWATKDEIIRENDLSRHNYPGLSDSEFVDYKYVEGMVLWVDGTIQKDEPLHVRITESIHNTMLRKHLRIINAEYYILNT